MLTLKLLIFSLLALPVAVTYATECNPAPKNIATLHQLRPNWFSIRGPLAEFDPCHSSVSLSRPSGAEKTPLIIVVHGGIGLSKSVQIAAHEFRSMGFSTLVFDAFEMNKLSYLGWEFFNTQMTNEARQRMIFKVTRGAYEWAIRQDKIDSERIYFWGNSNGAMVSVNMAAVVPINHVKGIFVEGLPPVGLGLPNKINVPIFIAFGESDNYGTNASLNQTIWNRTGFCRENTSFGNLTNRNSINCNEKANPNEPVETVWEWYNRLKNEGQPIQIKIYPDAAHDFFSSGPQRGSQMKNGTARGANTGATFSARNNLLKDIEYFFSQSK